MFKAKQVDAAVTWEPDLSGAVTARGDEAHVLVSTTAATNIIADTLVARQDLIDQAPETVRDFVHGWFDGIEMIKSDPAPSYAVVAKALKLDNDTVSGMLSGLKLTPFADNAQFYGLTGGKAHFETLFDTAFVIWRKKGLVTRAVDAKDWADTRFLAALAAALPRPEGRGAEARRQGAASPRDRAIINKQIQIHFTPGSDEIMPGSFFVLDALGDTMTSFGNTYLRVEGNTDSTGPAAANMTLSERRALAVKNYILKNFPNIQATRFQTIGRGSANPVADNATEAGRQLNRRTDIKVVLATRVTAHGRAQAHVRESDVATNPDLRTAPLAPAARRRFAARASSRRSCVLGAWCVADLRRVRAARLPAVADRGRPRARCSSSSSTTCGARS